MLSSKDLPELVKDVTLGASIPGVVLSVLFLAAVAYLQWNPVSRPHLDRTWKKQVLAALSSHSYMGLVLILGVNGNKMEKYYLLGVAILCGACNIPPWLAGKFGWDATTGKCWLRDPSPAVQQRWIIGTRGGCCQSLQLESKIERLRADTSGSVTPAPTLPKHPILQFRPIIMRIGRLRLYTGMHQNPTDFHMNLRILNACVYSIRPLLYALLAAIDPYVHCARSHYRRQQQQFRSGGRRCSWRDNSVEQVALSRKHHPREIANASLGQKRNFNRRRLPQLQIAYLVIFLAIGLSSYPRLAEVAPCLGSTVKYYRGYPFHSTPQAHLRPNTRGNKNQRKPMLRSPENNRNPSLHLFHFCGDQVISDEAGFIRDVSISREVVSARNRWEGVKVMLFNFTSSGHNGYCGYLLEMVADL
ncbi:hypothetical protein B0H13DRAFT_1890905 [Mycena leptocephala]|nr:hypothetical protein B0H13DRAFT_1890905 [Mycena leptocephala]